MIQVEIPMKVESLNVLLRLHWASRRRLKNQWAIMLKSRLHEAKRAYKFVQIHAFRNRLLDYDNLVGGCKEAIVDNLKDLGFIEDDSPDKVNVIYNQSKVRRDLEGVILALW